MATQGLAGRAVQYRNMFDCAAKIARLEGVRGFYRGSAASFFKIAPNIAFTYLLQVPPLAHLK